MSVVYYLMKHVSLRQFSFDFLCLDNIDLQNHIVSKLVRLACKIGRSLTARVLKST